MSRTIAAVLLAVLVAPAAADDRQQPNPEELREIRKIMDYLKDPQLAHNPTLLAGKCRDNYNAGVPFEENPAKRIAAAIVDRQVTPKQFEADRIMAEDVRAHLRKVEVVAGVNLPMLIKLVEVRESTTLAEAVQVGRDAGQKYIRIASEVMDRTA